MKSSLWIKVLALGACLVISVGCSCTSDTANKLKNSAGEAMESAVEKAGSVVDGTVDRAVEKTNSVVDSAAGKAGEVMNSAVGKAGEVVNSAAEKTGKVLERAAFKNGEVVKSENKGKTMSDRSSSDVKELEITEVKVGTGDEATTGATVDVHYVGTLLDGKKFDSSRDRGQAFSFPLGAGRVIKGWDEGVKGMKVGGMRKLVIPSDMAYGPRAMGDVIPANSALVFEVELLGVSKPL